MPTKCCWVIHGSLTSEPKASTSPSSFINHSTLLLNRALKRQAPCLLHALRSSSARQAQTQSESERVDALGLHAVEVIICMITRDFSVTSMTSQASLSLYLSQKSLTHNIWSASALPIIKSYKQTFYRRSRLSKKKKNIEKNYGPKVGQRNWNHKRTLHVNQYEDTMD